MGEYDDLLPEVLAEASELLERVYTVLADPKWNPLGGIDEMYRAIHSIKGNCSVMGLDEIASLSHDLETHLGQFRKGGLPQDDGELRNIYQQVDAISNLVEQARNGPNPDGSQAPPDKRSAPDMVRVPVTAVGQALNNLSEVFLIQSQIAWLIQNKRSVLKADLEFMQAWETLDAALRRNISELEDAVMSMRMTPLTGLFSRMEKAVRDYQEKVPTKKIRFVTSGSETEVDKKIVDMLAQPLIHLVRNAMDHGAECIEDRERKGKASESLITLSAETGPDSAVFRVSDDGQGMVPEQILKAAQRKGIDTSKVRDSRDMLRLIFAPGFSTAAEITDVSGRGVGMNVVLSSIEDLGGEVEIETSPRGSTISLTVPLSVAVVPMVVTRINNLTYGSMVSNVVEIVRTTTKELQSNTGTAFFRLRDRFIPMVDLRSYLQGKPDAPDGPATPATLCIVKVRGELVGVRVSEVTGSAELVVKPLPAEAPSLSFVSGVSILPTGRPIFVLSLEKLVEDIRSGSLDKYKTPRSRSGHAA